MLSNGMIYDFPTGNQSFSIHFVDSEKIVYFCWLRSLSHFSSLFGTLDNSIFTFMSFDVIFRRISSSPYFQRFFKHVTFLSWFTLVHDATPQKKTHQTSIAENTANRFVPIPEKWAICDSLKCRPFIERILHQFWVIKNSNCHRV